MLDDNIVALVLIWHAELIQQLVSGLANNHGTKQLPSKPCAASGCHTLFNQGNLRIAVLTVTLNLLLSTSTCSCERL